MTTPQLDSALTPLKHLPPDGRVYLRASVAVLTDPIETPMGKSFDMEVAAILRAYQARGYELDGFAFAWQPRKVPSETSEGVQGTNDYARTHRSEPSLLLFRKDRWRSTVKVVKAWEEDEPDVAYELVFVVGDAPSYGIQPKAFFTAARCALLFNDKRVRSRELEPTKSCDRPIASGRRTLDVIGPTFSGSMQSLAVAVGRLGCKDFDCVEQVQRDDITVRLISPSASVPTNKAIAHHGFVAGTVNYYSMSWTLKQQMTALTDYLCRNNLVPDRKIVFLVEESTFGQGAKDLSATWKTDLESAWSERRDKLELLLKETPQVLAGPDGEKAAAKRLSIQSELASLAPEVLARVRETCVNDHEGRSLSITAQPFSPNIASIRAEHSRLRKAALAAREKVQTTTSRLLELDMTGVEAGNARPPVFQPSLSSRSDELMLFRLFDSMRVWGKPNVVVIIATDVRDRLFLLSEVRKALPAALPVMLEMDYLVVHPDYRDISRGAITVPARDTTVCVGNESGNVEPCWSRLTLGEICRVVPLRECVSKAWQKFRPESSQQREGRTRIAFSTDLAANVFRAVHVLVGSREDEQHDETVLADQFENALCVDPALCRPRLYVATLAGFESLDDERRTMMVAADSRIAMQRLWYLAVMVMAVFMLLVGTWLLWGARGTCVMSNFTRHVILDSRWLISGLRWVRARIWRGLKTVGDGKGAGPENDPPGEGTEPADAAPGEDKAGVALLSPVGRGVLVTLTLIAAAVLFVTLIRLSQVTFSRSDDWVDPCLGGMACRFSLAHGRDVLAVYCIWGLYACLAILGGIRLYIAGGRHEIYAKSLGWTTATKPWLIPVTIMLVVVIVLFLSDARPISVDGQLPWLFAMIALVCGVAFLVALGWHMSNLARLTLSISRCIEPIRLRKGMAGWPSPQSLQEPVQTPFNLSMEADDVKALGSHTLQEWISETTSIIAGQGIYPPTKAVFKVWQQRLVAELKLLVVAIRFSAWCAMGAPLAVLLAMSVYPPIYERWLRTTAIAMLLIGFVCTVIVVLRLEKDAMLGPMFTRDGDALTFGGSLRALWPKFLAMGVVLVPLVLPDVVNWINTLVRSINSLG